jgi:hypothetical protein
VEPPLHFVCRIRLTLHQLFAWDLHRKERHKSQYLETMLHVAPTPPLSLLHWMKPKQSVRYKGIHRLRHHLYPFHWIDQ